MDGDASPGPVLALDTGSPEASLAIGLPGEEPCALRTVAQRQSSERLLALIDDALHEAGVRLADLRGLVALRGPGSFTGLRIGLATLFGLHQGSGVAAVAVPSLAVLAEAAPPGATAVAAVDALRGEWFTQAFTADRRPLGPPSTLRADLLGSLTADVVVGHGLPAAKRGAAPRQIDPGPLAPHALRHIVRLPPVWDAATLLEPLYLRPPSAVIAHSVGRGGTPDP